jgi:hypothetical protein
LCAFDNNHNLSASFRDSWTSIFHTITDLRRADTHQLQSYFRFITARVKPEFNRTYLRYTDRFG